MITTNYSKEDIIIATQVCSAKGLGEYMQLITKLGTMKGIYPWMRKGTQSTFYIRFFDKDSVTNWLQLIPDEELLAALL